MVEAAMDPGPPRDDVVLTRWDGRSEETLSQALAPPATDCIEIELGEAPRETASEGGRHLTLTISTRSAYRVPVVKVFIKAMTTRTALPEELVERIHMAAQEALMNAVLHGNLKIDASLRGSLENLMAMHERIEASLGSAATARAAIAVEAVWNAREIHVLIRDSGEGFKRSDEEAPAVELAGDRAHGRGLAILDTVCDRFELTEGGRTARLSFKR